MNKILMVKIFFMLFLSLYIILLFFNPQLGPSDEYHFLPTLQSGKWFPFYGKDFPYYNSVELGRFSPLGGQEYNLVALISNTPLAYFTFNAILLLGFIFIFLKILNEFSSNRTANYLAISILLFMPAVTNTFFKLLYVEKNVIFYLAISLISFIAFQKQQKVAYFIITLLSVNIAIYYKEIVFIAVAVFSAGHSIFSWKDADKKNKLLDGLLIVSAVIYVCIYVITILPNRGQGIYLPKGGNEFIAFFKNAFNYGFFSDPITILILIPLTIWRIYAVFLRREKSHVILDPMLGAGAAYTGAFILLNMYSPYYLLPAYLFALPPILYFFEKGKMKNLFWKATFTLAAFVLITNTIPLGIHYITYNKYVPVNFNKTLDFLIIDINKKYNGHRRNIFFDGVDRGTGSGVYFITGEFLKFKGLSIRKFDFKSDMEAQQPGPFVGRRSPFDKDADIEAVNPEHTYKYPDFPFEVFQPSPLPQIQGGDYLIVSPHSTKNVNNEYIEKLKDDYTMVFHTHSPLAFPRVTLKTGVKYLMSRAIASEEKAKMIINENLMNWPDYYVFVKK